MGWDISLQNCQRFLPLSKLLIRSNTSVLLLGIALGSIGNSGWALASDGEEISEPVNSSFTCELQNGEYTVMYRPKSEPSQSYPWAVPTELGGGWTPQRRCETISERLEEYRPDGLVELRTDVENGYDIVCATTEEDLDNCRIVFTIPPGQDPMTTRDAVFANITLADAGTDTNAVNTFVSGSHLPNLDALGSGSLNESIAAALGSVLSNQAPQASTYSDGINLKPHLDPSDGGTGDYLK